MRNRITYIIILISAFLISAFSCKKSGDPLPGKENVVSAQLSFSGQTPVLLKAERSATLFVKLIEASQKKTSITIQGNHGGNSQSWLVLGLHDITKPGTYQFNQFLKGSEFVTCQYYDDSSGDLYSICRMPSPGSVTIKNISDNFIEGVFNAELTNFYPGSTGSIKYVSVSNGYFKGKLETEIR